jgi:hypothetical protein
MSTIKFGDPRFFGSNFKQKYARWKQQRLNELGEVDFRQVMPAVMAITDAERPNRVQLEQLAITTAKSLFPVIDTAGLQFDVELRDEVSHKSISEDGTPDFPEELPELDDETFKQAAKQKILNAFAQGAAVSMNTVHHMVPELDRMSPDLKENYDRLMKANEVAYLTVPEDEFVQMACASNEDENIGGTNRVVFRNHVPVVVAKAQHFVTLIHEIIKGVYTYLALNAYDDEFDYHNVNQYTDSIASEIEDIGCGKMILNMLRDYLLDDEKCNKYYEHESFFEMYFVKLSKLEPDDLISLINGLLAGTPNKAKLEAIARECYYDLKEFEKQKSGF